jgi:hypothetical protein
MLQDLLLVLLLDELVSLKCTDSGNPSCWNSNEDRVTSLICTDTGTLEVTGNDPSRLPCVQQLRSVLDDQGGGEK